MIKKCRLIAIISAALAIPSVALNVDYKGHVSVDFHLKASLQLKIEGNQVAGELYANPVSGQNVRLPGARMKLRGALTGNWEDGGSISGDCTGSILWPGGRPEERAGQFWISKTGDGILFRSTKFYYNRYIFNPTGVKYVPPNDPGKDGKKKPGGPKNIKSSLILLIDCSGSMTDKPDKFERFKATAKTSLASLGPSCEMALIVFAGCNNIKLEREFTPMTDTAKNDFTAAIDALTTSGGTPLAQALSYAGDYMRTFAAGQTRQIILLSDGSETCNGDPAAAAAGLNIRQIGGPPKTDGQPPPGEPLDPDAIEEITVQPRNIEMQPGSERELPEVTARMKDGERKIVPLDQVKWQAEAGAAGAQWVEFRAGKIQLGRQAKPGATIKLTAIVKRAKDELKATCQINVKDVVQVGRVTCRICFDFDPPVEREDFQLQAADVQVTRCVTGDTVTRRLADGKAVFDNLARGNYRAAVVNARMSKLPDGYAMVARTEEFLDASFEIPRGDYSDHFSDREKTTPACTCAAAAPSAAADGGGIPPPSGSSCPWHYDVSVTLKYANRGVLNHGCVYGQATFNGEGVEGVKVSAAKTGHQRETESDGDGFYKLDLNGMEAGTYWIRALRSERYDQPGWAHPKDLLDAASHRDQRSVTVDVPTGPGGVEINIVCVERNPGGDPQNEEIADVQRGPRKEDRK